MKQEIDQSWQQMSQEILTEIKAWREAHPKATFREIEQEVHERMSRLEAQVLQETALASSKREWGEGSEQEPPPRLSMSGAHFAGHLALCHQ